MRAVRKAKGSSKATRRAPSRGDAQKAKIYAWEDSHSSLTCFNRLGLWECEALVESACVMAGIKPPRVTVHYQAEMSYSQTASEEDSVISLQGWSEINGYRGGGMNEVICLHEVAHTIQAIQRPRTSDHGPIFAGIYAKLLLDFAVFDPEELEAEWLRFGIRWRR